MTSLNVLDGRTYYHGTSPTSAVCISEEGFRILDSEIRYWGGAMGPGIYVTRRLKESLIFGGLQSKNHTYVLRVEFIPGTKVARIDDEASPKVLDSLRREFGQEVLGPRFAQAIPGNKHLKPRELFALIGHLEKTNLLFEEKTAKRQVRRWLQRLGYHGYGHTLNDLGVMLFDPSRLVLREVARLCQPEEHPFLADLSNPLLQHVKPAELVADAEAELQTNRDDMAEEEADAELQADMETDEELRRSVELDRAELERRSQLLARYRKRNGLVRS